MTDMDIILKWMNETNRDIERLKEEVKKVRETLYNVKYNSDLFLKIQKFGVQMSEMSRRILRLETDGSST